MIQGWYGGAVVSIAASQQEGPEFKPPRPGGALRSLWLKGGPLCAEFACSPRVLLRGFCPGTPALPPTVQRHAA